MKITPNFSLEEFMCKCGCKKALINERLVERLQLICYKTGKPMYISSGYRCPAHDMKTGGIQGAHSKGLAADVRVEGYTSKQLAAIAEDFYFGGIGLIDDNYVHLDIRDEGDYYDSHGTKQTHWFGDERTNANFTTFKEAK